MGLGLIYEFRISVPKNLLKVIGYPDWSGS